jgi:type 1 glutamine amidotransferase
MPRGKQQVEQRRGFFARMLRAVFLIAVVCAALSLVFVWRVGAWHLLFPSQEHDTVAPYIPVDMISPAVLVFSKTNSFRHVEGIDKGSRALRSIVRGRSWGLFATENGAVFNAQDLARFDAVVFLNASGDMLNAEQELAFQEWLEGGGGWLGLHAAGDSSHAGWQWYRDNLIGADFTAHIMGPQFQRASVVLENHAHPVLRGLPDIWEHEEEWYSWEQSPRGEGFTILATLDEESYSPVQKMLGKERDLRMGDHPVVWTNCVGMGRSVYTAMGHKGEAFEHPQIVQLLTNALDWIMGGPPESCAEAIIPRPSG